MYNHPVSPGNPIAPPQKTQQRFVPVEQAMKQASALQAQGQLQQSEDILQQILKKQPHHPEALHLLGIIAHQVGKTDKAIELICKALAGNDSNGLFHSNLGEMYRQAGNLEKAIVHGEKAILLDPNYPSAHSNLGIAYYDNKAFMEAERCQLNALHISPALPCALNNMGSIMREYKNVEDAIGYYRKAYSVAPTYLEPLNNLGSLFIREERYEEAVDILKQAVRINPRNATAHCNLGFAFKGLTQLVRADEHFRIALQLRPEYPEAYLGMSKVFQDAQNHEMALRAGLKAIELAPEMADAHLAVANMYAQMDEEKKSSESYYRVLSIKADSVSALIGLGSLNLVSGKMKEAEDLFHQALSHAHPDDPAPRFHLTQMKKVMAGCENMNALMAAADNIDKLSDSRQLLLHYALGKCYDDTGDADRAFGHFLAGAQLKRKTITFDSRAQQRSFDTVLAALDAGTIDRLRGNGVESHVPIFIVGVPRSGTTLTEQIIASHRDVHGAGELNYLFNAAQKRIEANGISYRFPENLQHLTPAIVNELGREYLGRMQSRAPEAKHITDKMPGNFAFIGLIHLLMPNAKIIHVQRNPVDTCISCFTRLFQYGLEHTYDLAETGHYYRHYVKIMDHWRRVLPPGTLYDVKYEDIVHDTEHQARKLLDYCGLGWDDNCLKFHKNTRMVRTPSLAQVRKPIYSSSVDRWRAYQAHITPLLEALGDIVRLHE